MGVVPGDAGVVRHVSLFIPLNPLFCYRRENTSKINGVGTGGV